MSTLSEQVGLRKEVDGTNRRTALRPVEMETENREYVADGALIERALSAPEMHAGTAGEVHPSTFWQDTLVRTVDTPVLVRRSLTRWEAFKALFQPDYARPLVAVEVELTKTELVLDDV